MIKDSGNLGSFQKKLKWKKVAQSKDGGGGVMNACMNCFLSDDVHDVVCDVVCDVLCSVLYVVVWMVVEVRLW